MLIGVLLILLVTSFFLFLYQFLKWKKYSKPYVFLLKYKTKGNLEEKLSSLREELKYQKRLIKKLLRKTEG